MAAAAYPSNRPRRGRSSPARDTRPTSRRPKPANDNRRPMPRPANDNRPNPLPGARGSLPRLPSLRAATALRAVNIGTLILNGFMDLAIHIGREAAMKQAGAWQIVQNCYVLSGPPTSFHAIGDTLPATCNYGLSSSPGYATFAELVVAQPLTRTVKQYMWGGTFKYMADNIWQRPVGSSATPVPYWDPGYVSVPAIEPAVVPRISPLLIPSIDPLMVPVGAPQVAPSPVPYPMIPRLPRVDPNRDPLEQPRRGPAPRPRPRPRVRPRPRPDEEPQTNPVRPTVPSDVPAVNIVQRPGTRARVSPNGRHELRKPGRGEKERKTDQYRLGLQLINRTLGVATEVGDAIDAAYKAIPGRIRRFKGRDGQWRERVITPQDKAIFVYKHANEVDMNKFLLNLLANEVGDRLAALPGQANPNRSNLLGTGVPGAPF